MKIPQICKTIAGCYLLGNPSTTVDSDEYATSVASSRSDTQRNPRFDFSSDGKYPFPVDLPTNPPVKSGTGNQEYATTNLDGYIKSLETVPTGSLWKYLEAHNCGVKKSQFYREIDTFERELRPYRSRWRHESLRPVRFRELKDLRLDNPYCVAAVDQICSRSLVGTLSLTVKEEVIDKVNFKHCNLDILMLDSNNWGIDASKWNIPNMKSLEIEGDQNFVHVLGANPQLKTISVTISSELLSDEEGILAAISNMSNLKKLILETPYPGSHIPRALLELTRLTDLELSFRGGSWKEENMPSLSVTNSRQLKRLVLRDVELSSKLSTQLLDSLASRNVKVLEFENVKISDFPYESFNKILKENKSLQTLALRSCEIGQEGITAIFKNLPYLPNLKSLILSGLNMKSSGFKVLVDQLDKKTDLVELRITDDDLSGVSANTLAQIIRQNRNLEIFSFADSHLNVNQVELLMFAGFGSRKVKAMGVSSQNVKSIHPTTMNRIKEAYVRARGIELLFDSSGSVGSERLLTICLDHPNRHSREPNRRFKLLVSLNHSPK